MVALERIVRVVSVCSDRIFEQIIFFRNHEHVVAERFFAVARQFDLPGYRAFSFSLSENQDFTLSVEPVIDGVVVFRAQIECIAATRVTIYGLLAERTELADPGMGFQPGFIEREVITVLQQGPGGKLLFIVQPVLATDRVVVDSPVVSDWLESRIIDENLMAFTV